MATYINVHTHIFSINHVPEYVIGQNRWKIPISVRRFGGLHNVILKPIAPFISLFTGSKPVERLMTFAQLGLATDQLNQWESLADYYKPLGHDFRFVVLPMDMEQMGAGQAKSNVYSQLADLIEMRQNPEVERRMIPFVPVDPRRPEFHDGNDILNFVKTYIEKYKFGGIKLYPALGYFPFDPKLLEMYEYAIENEVPIMVHCIAGVIHWQGSLDHWRLMLQVAQGLPGYTNDPQWDKLSDADKLSRRDLFQRNFTQPNNYQVLVDLLRHHGVKNVERLKICLGHFGMDDDNWFATCRKLLADNPQFYADVSYVVSDDKLLQRMREVMGDVKIRDRILFGTDFFVVSKAKKEDEILKSYLNHVASFEPYASTNATNYLSMKQNPVSPNTPEA